MVESEVESEEEADFEACRKFRECGDSGDYIGALNIFRTRPALTDYMRLVEIPVYYASILKYAAPSEAQMLRDSLRTRLQRVFSEVQEELQITGLLGSLWE